MRGWVECEVNASNLKQNGWRRKHGGAETSICKCSQTVLAEWLAALSRLVEV